MMVNFAIGNALEVSKCKLQSPFISIVLNFLSEVFMAVRIVNDSKTT